MDKKNIAAIYPLTPLQQAFLWHGLQTSTQAGLLQVRCTLQGNLETQQLRQAWERVIAQHPALRSSIHWEGVKQPLQVVARQVTVPWSEREGRPNPQQAVEDFLATDMAQTLDLSKSPIMRLTLIRLAETTYELVWTCHHLMLDGWSAALVINQVADTYAALADGQPDSPAHPVPTFQTYTRWLAQQDTAAAAAFWRSTLANYVGQPLPVLSGPQAAGQAALHLGADISARLQAMLRAHRLTLNTLMQGIWALCLYQHSGQADVIFGATVSGRQGNLPNVESIVGLLINVLPVRAKLDLDQPAIKWLQGLQAQQLEASQHAHASLAQIQTWSGITGSLFNSLLVIENYPIPSTDESQALQVTNLQSGIVSTYGLTLVVKPGEDIELHLEGHQLSPAAMDTLLHQFRDLLTQLVRQPEQPLNTLVPEPLASASPQNPPPNLHRDSLEQRFNAPANPLELKLAQIWETVLNVHPLSVTDSFFDLGGNSLLAVQLFNQMQTQLDCTLPLATLFQAPTVRQFTALLSEKNTALQWKSLVPIQTSGTRPPLFFHGGSADALTWARFAHLLGTDQPFYALQRPDLDGSDVVHHTVEALATDCIKEMRMIQPRGPYRVGGHCFGGAVAFEIAQQLQAAGEIVTDLILVDAYRPEVFSNRPWVQRQLQLQQAYFWLRKNYYYHADFSQGGWSRVAQLPAKVWQRLAPAPAPPAHPQDAPPQDNRDMASSPTPSHDNLIPDRAAAQTPSPGTSSPGTSPPKSIPYEYRYARAQTANEQAAADYLARPYDGAITLFRAQVQTLDWHFGSALGWQDVAKNRLEIVTVPGFFGNLFNQRSGPHLAKAVNQHLSQQIDGH